MRFSHIPVWLAALVGVAMLTASSALLVSALTEPASDSLLIAPVTVENIAPTASMLATTNARITVTIAEQPDIICRHCTEVPLPTATAVSVEVSPTPTSLPPSVQPTAPPAPTVRPTRVPTRVPTASATIPAIGTARPTATPTRPRPTSTASPASPTMQTQPSSTVQLPTRTPTPSSGPTVTRVPQLTPPTPQVRAQLWMLSEFDPVQQVYRSATNEVTWPGGEVLHFAPAITLEVPTSPDPAYQVRARVTAWSFISSHGANARDRDSMGQIGCRLRTQPAPSDAVGLAGCAYRYLEAPTVEDLHMQAHAFWSVGKPLEMCMDIYVYDLGQLRTTDLVLQARVLTEVVEVATGQVVSHDAEIVTLPFAVTLVVPRSAQ